MHYTEIEMEEENDLDNTETDQEVNDSYEDDESTETVIHDEDESDTIEFLGMIGGAEWKSFETEPMTIGEFIDEQGHDRKKAVVTNKAKNIQSMDDKLVSGEYYVISFANTTGGIK